MIEPAYINEARLALRRLLHVRGRSCELAYTPGNGTMYPLVFVPVGYESTDLKTVAEEMDDPRRRSVFADEHPHVHREDGWVLVSWLGHGAWIFRLCGDTPNPPHWVYVREKFADCTDGDAEALAGLFRGLGGAHSVAAANLRPTPTQPLRSVAAPLHAVEGGGS